ncbi:MAG TPA: hypothetical protein VH298_01500 [Jatrophihabitans sp.]|nr:hypothetical protein [Jatrophihabitans sp.]
MNLNDTGHRVREQLIAAAALGDERTREVAATLAQAAESAVRLVVIEALSRASTELADALADAATLNKLSWAPEISVQLDGDRLGFAVAVSQPVTEPVTSTSEAAEPEVADRGEATARISLRLSESLKAAIERAADRAEISVNSWLVRLATDALQSKPTEPVADARAPWSGNRGGNRVTGWITG